MSAKTDTENQVSGVIAARKCSDCGHHEVGLTTADGRFVAFKPGMAATLEPQAQTSIVKPKTEIAAEKFLQTHNCAQSVLFTFCADLGLDPETTLKLACGLGAGMARKQEVCGAVSGGVLAIGAKYGRGANDDIKAAEKTYAKTRTLMESFEKVHGSVICGKLLDGCNLLTEQGQKQFKAEGLFEKTCLPSVQTVVKILEEIL
jgi:C_GCAxxG_C_C family probable redox protein